MKLDWPQNLIIKEFIKIDSTNDEAKRLARDNNFNYLILAELQTKGRGRNGKEWVSESGNLYFSLLMKENYSLEYLSIFSTVTSLAVAKMLTDFGISKDVIKLKWPNDILVNEKKISGILLETKINDKANSLEYLIIGCGVNIATCPEVEHYKTTSFFNEKNEYPDKNKMLQALLSNISHYIKFFEQNGFQQTIELWREFEWGIERKVSLIVEGKKIQAKYKGIANNGVAVVNLDDGSVLSINSGELLFY